MNTKKEKTMVIDHVTKIIKITVGDIETLFLRQKTT